MPRNQRVMNSTYTVSLVVHEAKVDGTGTLNKVYELVDTQDYFEALKIAKRLANTYECTKEIKSGM